MDRDALKRSRTKRNSNLPALGIAVTATALLLSACAGPAARQPAVPSPSKSKVMARPTASQATAATPQTTIQQLSVMVLDPRNLSTARKKREDALTRHMDSDALTPNNVGYYMEVEEADLRRQLSAGAHIKIAKKDANIMIGPIGRAFSSGSSQLGGKLRTALDTIAPVLMEFSKTLVIIHAYTDESGPTEYNQALSIRRATAVAHYLLKAGVSSSRLLAVGHGETGKAVSNGTAKDRAKNRRILIELAPLVRQRS